MTHPRLEYLLVAVIAAVVTFLLTPLARAIAIRIGAVALPRDRDVHAVAIPRMGGVAMFCGIALALLTASKLPSLRTSFEAPLAMPWVVAAAALLCLLGVIDDKYELDSLTKLAGQVLATGLMVTQGGVQLAEVYVPFGDFGTISLDRDAGIPITIVLTVVTINAMNFIDGLDGLAAGVAVISAAAFAIFSFHLSTQGYQSLASAPTLLAAVLAGACLGFLPHNFYPARLFMGDSGSMLVGLLLAASATTATTSVDPQAFNHTLGTLAALPLFMPLVPIVLLAIPFIDLLLAIVRRISKGRSPFAPDKRHLHHRLLEMGHSQRRAVLFLYFWSVVLSGSFVALSYPGVEGEVAIAVSVVVVSALVYSAAGRLRRRRRMA
jgi:UDP-GlcNAc:undecaprenyl-phosphate GlcNAc-1-phosphate transferase